MASVLDGQYRSGGSVLDIVRDTIEREAAALVAIAERVDENYERAVQAIRDAEGKVVLTGMGKSGLIARKIAATMASTGTLAVFLHPAEAAHGDLGILRKGDVLIALGKSGESDELNTILPVVRRIGATIVAITGNLDSTLARNADIVLFGGVAEEACPHDLAPTASTTVALAIGDALAMALMTVNEFRPNDFALFHPGGRLGRRLLLAVSDVMIPYKECPVLDPSQASMKDVLVALSGFGLGVVLFAEKQQDVVGILTDGDVRRMLEKFGKDVFSVDLKNAINRKFEGIQQDWLAVEALRFMEDRSRPLNVTPVFEHDVCLGVIRLHDLLRVA